MSMGMLAPGEIPLSEKEALLAGVSQSLRDAYGAVQGIDDIVTKDAWVNDEDLSPEEHALRLSQAGDWAARYIGQHESDRIHPVALRLLASAAHFSDVRGNLNTFGGYMSSWERAPLVHFACHYNGLVRSFGWSEPQVMVDSLRLTMAASYQLVRTEGGLSRAKRQFGAALRGVRHELWGHKILSYAEQVRGTSLEDDLSGIDAVLRVSRTEGIPIDITASPSTVAKKCALAKPVAWGIRGGVLVMWSGVRDVEMGQTFAVDPSRARAIYSRDIARVVLAARNSRKIRRVEW